MVVSFLIKEKGTTEMHHYIESSAWEQILLYLRTLKGIHTKDEDKLRLFLEAVWYVTRSGCQWRLLPLYYGCWRAIHKRFKSWSETGVIEGFLRHLTKEYDREFIMIDSTIIRAHPCSAGYKKNQQDREALGRSKGGFTPKIHAVVDSLGQALRFSLTPGQRHDINQASALIQNFEGAHVIADKGYDSNALIEQIQNQNCTAVIPSKSNRRIPRDYDRHLYKERHLVECFFHKIKQFRRLFSRFDKTAEVYLAFLCFAPALIWMR